MSYNEQLQRIVKKYEDAGNPLPATAHDIAIWAIEQGLWEPQRSTVVDRCAEEIARAMREEGPVANFRLGRNESGTLPYP